MTDTSGVLIPLFAFVPYAGPQYGAARVLSVEIFEVNGAKEIRFDVIGVGAIGRRLRRGRRVGGVEIHVVIEIEGASGTDAPDFRRAENCA